MSLLTKLNNTAQFNITLDQVNRYKAGALVSGYLSLVSEQPEGQTLNIGSISITFSGRTTTTKLCDLQSHRRSLQLFSFNNQVYDGPGKWYAPYRSLYGDSRPLWSFSFTFPTDCEHSQTENFEGTPFFDSDRSQPLPPSFTDYDLLDKASVVYELSVELLAAGFSGYIMEGSFVQKQVLNLYTQRNVREPSVQYVSNSKTIIRQGLELLPPAEREFHKRPMTIAQKLGLKPMSVERYPKAAFEATILMPSVAIVDQPLPLMLHIDHNPNHSTAASPPVIHLKQVQVWLRAETSFCGMTHKTMKLETAKDCAQNSWTVLSVIARKDFEKASPGVEHLDLRKVVDLRLDPSLIPTFRTFNIARTYSLNVGARIECAGKDFHIWSPGYVKCTLLAGDFSPPNTVEGEVLTDHPPPPYEQVAGSRGLVQPIVPREPSLSRTAGRRHGRSNNANVMAAAVMSSIAGAASSSSRGGGCGGC